MLGVREEWRSGGGEEWRSRGAEERSHIEATGLCISATTTTAGTAARPLVGGVRVSG